MKGYLKEEQFIDFKNRLFYRPLVKGMVMNLKKVESMVIKHYINLKAENIDLEKVSVHLNKIRGFDIKKADLVNFQQFNYLVIDNDGDISFSWLAGDPRSHECYKDYVDITSQFIKANKVENNQDAIFKFNGKTFKFDNESEINVGDYCRIVGPGRSIYKIIDIRDGKYTVSKDNVPEHLSLERVLGKEAITKIVEIEEPGELMTIQQAVITLTDEEKEDLLDKIRTYELEYTKIDYFYVKSNQVLLGCLIGEETDSRSGLFRFQQAVQVGRIERDDLIALLVAPKLGRSQRIESDSITKDIIRAKVYQKLNLSKIVHAVQSMKVLKNHKCTLTTKGTTAALYLDINTNGDYDLLILSSGGNKQGRVIIHHKDLSEETIAQAITDVITFTGVSTQGLFGRHFDPYFLNEFNKGE